MRCFQQITHCPAVAQQSRTTTVHTKRVTYKDAFASNTCFPHWLQRHLTRFTMLLFPGFLFLSPFVLVAKGSIPSRNITASTGVFLSYNEYNSNAVYEAWKGPGELSLVFNSRKPTAFLAYQDDGTYSHFDLFLINGKVRARVTFDKCQWKQLTIERNFSDSRWHRVRLARQLNNVTLTVDGCYSESIPCKYTSSKTEKWQALYVGSIPWDISMNSLAKPGIFRETIESV